MRFYTVAVLAFATAVASLTGCGILTAPFSVASAVKQNADYTFGGAVVDPSQNKLTGVIASLDSARRWWTPIAGGKTEYSARTVRIDGEFTFDVRGSNLDIRFQKDGYRDVEYHFSASEKDEVSTNVGNWPNTRDFRVLMVPVNARDSYLVQHGVSIDCDKYPIADAISLTNLSTGGHTGDVVFKDKDATDPTVFPDGTLYLVLDRDPPQPINSAGDIDPTDLDIPSRVSFRLPGVDSGFQRIKPIVGLHPMLASITAPETGYTPEISFNRERLKEMRLAEYRSIMGAHEYFYFRTGNRYGKGVFSWKTRSGKPAFNFEIYMQQRTELRDLATYSYAK